jgi:uncharacterized membrane protein
MATKLGMDLPKNTAAALSYVLGPVTGVLFLLIGRDPYVRFHAMQSIVVFGVLIVLQWVFAITIILWVLAQLLGIFTFVLWLLLIYKAWLGEEYEMPILGKYARQLVKKV